MSGVLSRRKPGEGGIAVRYTPCAKSDNQADGADEVEEEGGQGRQIAIVGEEEEPPAEYAASCSSGGGRAGSQRSFAGSDEKGGIFQLSKVSTARRRGGRERGKSWGSGGGESESGTGSSRGEYSGGEGSLPRAITSNNNEHYNAIRVDDKLDGFDDEDEDLFDSGHDLEDRLHHPYQYYHPHHHGDADDDIDDIDYEDDNDGRRHDTGAGRVPQTPSSLPVVTANGPRNLPPGSIFTSQQASSSTERDKLIGERLSSSDKISLSSPIYTNKVVDQKAKSTSKQSLLDLFSSRLDRVKATRKRFSLAQTSLMKKPRPSDGNIISAVTTRNQRRQRRKEIKRDFGKKSLIRGGHGVLADTGKVDSGRPPGVTSGVGGASTTSDRDGCNWTFVFDPSGRLCYWWSSVVSVAFLYNFWVIIYRFAFQEINDNNIAVWFTLDYTADFLYFLDIAFHFRTGYLEDGVLQTDPTKLRIHYTNTTVFYIDCLCLLPIDFLYLSIGFCSIVRGFRLVKVYRFWSFLDRTERHTNYPNVIRTATLLHYLLALFHWNACLYFLVASEMDGVPGSWKFPKDENNTLLQYLHALYWSILTLTTIGDPPSPKSLPEYLFVIFELLFALLLFATVLGHIANIVTNVSAARKEFQARLDGVKTYMALRRVPLKLQDRVIKWFDYLWMCNKSADEEKSLGLLPDKLKAEIAIHVHLDTLKRVEIFQATEAGFLCELVLRLIPVLFSPGDYICRKGEVGKEMYIVNRGRLHVVADNGKTVLATLKPGSYFGEISILNMGTAGNRRTASVRSVGYSDLFCLSKNDLWDVLKEYPAARVKLEAIAVKRLEKYKKAPLEKVAMSRSRSTPGLVESTGQTPLDAMLVSRHHSTLPVGLQHSRGPDGRAASGSARGDSDGGGGGGSGGGGAGHHHHGYHYHHHHRASASGAGEGGDPSTRDDPMLTALTNTQSEDNLISRCAIVTTDYDSNKDGAPAEKGDGGAGPGGGRRLSEDDSQSHHNPLTTSMTISSAASYAGSPLQKSPMDPGLSSSVAVARNPFNYKVICGEDGSLQPQHHIYQQQQQQQNPLHLQVVSSTAGGNSGLSPQVNGSSPLSLLTPHHGVSPAPLSPLPAQYAAYQNMTYISSSGTPINFLSPFCPAPTGNYPASPSHFPGSPSIILPSHPQQQQQQHQQSLSSNSSGSYPHSPSLLHPSHLASSGNSPQHTQQQHQQQQQQQHQQQQQQPFQAQLSSLHPPLPHHHQHHHHQPTPPPPSPLPPRDTTSTNQSDMLLKEISRLRERLMQLEGENSSLTAKLNQQQWDVESRLTELEMHICQSDSVPSTDVDGDSLRADVKTTPPSVNRESII